MVFTDGTHLVASTLQELHEFAARIGLKRHFYHGVRKRHPHYDLTNKNAAKKAISNGAKQISTRRIIKMFQSGALKIK